MPDSVFELALRGTWNGKAIANVFHVKGDSLGDGLSTIAQQLADDLYRDHAARLDNAFNLATWHAREIAVNPSLFEGALTTPVTGISASAPTPTQASLVVTTRTGYAGRRKRGRHYLCGWTYEYIGQDGKWTAALTSAVQTQADSFIAGMPYGTGAYTWGVWSAKNGETRDASGNLTSVNIALGFTPITQAVVRNIPATQRRRRLAT